VTTICSAEAVQADLPTQFRCSKAFILIAARQRNRRLTKRQPAPDNMSTLWQGKLMLE
jgi:hypothetical protein